MYQFNVADMSCSHCANTITKAVKSEDANAKVDISLENHLVKVETQLSAQRVQQCIADAGYSPEIGRAHV